MKKLIAITTMALALASVARAERVNVGGYFSLDIPRSWEITDQGRSVNDSGEYIVYGAKDPVTQTHMKIHVSNGANTRGIYQYLLSATDADLKKDALEQQRVGYSVPVIRRDALNGIPVVFIRDERPMRGGTNLILRVLEVDMIVGEKFFFIKFAYVSADAPSVNRILDSILAGTNSVVPTAIQPQGDLDASL
jgi:hypothetical protein